ncbi:MAG TPA: DNA polymerase I [Gemmatimonas aurantiaca]|uniref:DNA polymerase I n=2 Tax=Gemmatimonas aurantiaca TaxID=173480 RepID=C1A3H5_GEMAT|nr:DNA polymerase I [Gemmatimonas aurantiaca]BAH37052.1 DNA polymerase I [Gemmatimonas aurantiaca T-27]HCT58917.1 DNA polymerase I [Gemmatimonas aurantiaca]
MADVTRPTAPRLFLIDGYALIYRAFFALLQRPLSTSRGENTSIAWGIASFLKRLLNTHQPELLAWVHDSGATFRDELYPDYKATREKLTDDLQADFDQGLQRVLQLLAAYDIPVLSAPGFEADDVIGTMAARGVEAGYNVVVVSGDKDFQQLVRPGVWLLNPGRGGPASVDESWVGVENGSDRLGVPPERVIDYLAIVGDTSDNVPGVKGIGEKGAIELITQYGPLENILANVENITKKRPREALQQYADSARLSKQLVTIHCDVPVPFESEKLTVGQPNTDALRALYLELEFTSLLKDVGGAVPVATSSGTGATSTAADVAPALPVPGRPAAPAVTLGESGVPVLADARYVTVDTVEALATLLTRVREVPYIAIDTETVIEPGAPFDVDALRSRLVGLSIAVAPGEAYYLPFAHRRDDGSGNLALLAGDTGTGIVGRRINAGAPEPVNLPPFDSDACAPLRAMLEDPSVTKIAQNAKYDLLVLRSSGVRVAGVGFDTMLASYVLDPGRRSHGLDLLALEQLGHTMTAYDTLVGKGKTQLPFDVAPVDTARDYSCEDVDITMRLRAKLEPMLAEHALLSLFQEIEVPLVSVLAEMEWEGIAIDLDWFASLKARFAAERGRVEQAIYAEAGEEFNINSNPKLRAILFEKLGLPVKKKTATGPSTDASVLQELAEEGHVLPTLLMEYREIFKLEGTYIDALPRLVHPRDRRLHTSYSQTVSATGRLSSHDPNLQNIPIRRELGRDIRRGFVPREGWRLLSADYSQIELRVLAHLSADPAFVSAFKAGGDIHRQTAAIIFGVPLEDVTSEMRARAKTINFATIYGQGAHALSRQLRITNAEAKAFIETYFERFAGVRGFLDQCVVDARARGYVETLFKRRRYIPELKERNFNIRAFGERVAQNAPIQGSAADLIKIAMINVRNAIDAEGLASRMLLQVHDELVFELPVEEADTLSALVKREMEGAAVLNVPLLVEMGLGTDWVSAKA